jgi:hypothetical protein
MRAISAAIVLLSGILLFATGYIPVVILGESRLIAVFVVGVPMAGFVLAVVGFLSWLRAFLADRRGEG